MQSVKNTMVFSRKLLKRRELSEKKVIWPLTLKISNLNSKYLHELCIKSVGKNMFSNMQGM
jgi:hypothetical protein